MSTEPRFQLQLMGGFCLRQRAPSEAVISVSAKKARALLAYVAMQEPRRISRERLATLLWPDRIDRQARQNLRKCLASLRHDLAGLADEVLAIDGETVGLSDVVGVDALELRKFTGIADGLALEHAATLCRGEFLADLAMEGEEFRDWVFAERAQLEAAAGTILATLASLADQAGEAAKALQASSRLTALDPLREDWQRLCLRITARHGGRDQALVQARNFVGLLKAELDVAPEAETAHLMEQIRSGNIAPSRKRDGLIGEIADSPAPLEALEQRPGAVALPQAGGSPDRRAAIASMVVAAVIALLIVHLSFLQRPGAGLQSLDPAVMAATAIDGSTIPLLVQPLRSETAETAALAHELTENELASLSQSSGLTVFDGRSPPGARAPSLDAAASPAIRFATWGSVRRQGSGVRLNVGLSDTTNQTVVWAGDFAASDDSTADLETAMARRIARELRVQAALADARGLDTKTLNTKTLELTPLHQLIAKAWTLRYLGSTPANDTLATSLYQEVLRRDPGSALALVGLAGELVMSSVNFQSEPGSTLARAERLINQALQIKPRIERAYHWLGIIDLKRDRPDLALHAFDRALAINPSFISAEAHAGFALVLAGRTNEGLARIQNALAASSDEANERTWLRFAGIAHLELGNDKQAMDYLLEAASLAVPDTPLHAALASAYALTGQAAKSREQFQLMKKTTDPAVLDHLLKIAASKNGPDRPRFWQGLRLAAGDTL